MAPLGTVAIITATPEGADELAELLSASVGATHQEAGCILYSLQRSTTDPAVFVTVEKWESQEALDAHLGSAHLAELLSKGGSLLAKPPQIVATTPMLAGDPSKYSY